jgi:hypothetical protein
MSRPLGKHAAQRRWNDISRQVLTAAVNERIRSAHAALRLCLTEIEQFHREHHPTCTGGCPGHEAMQAARAVLGLRDERTPKGDEPPSTPPRG